MQLLHKNFICLLFIICISFSTQAQGTFSNDADAPKIKEIQTSIATLVNFATNNFASNKGNLLVTYKANDKWVTKYQPKDISINMYADDAGIIEENETQKCFYEATYNNNASIKIAYNAFLTMFLVGKQWTTSSIPTTEKNSIKDLLIFNGQQVGIATNNPARNELYITIGLFSTSAKQMQQSNKTKKSQSFNNSKLLQRSIFSFRVIRGSSKNENENQSSNVDNLYSTGVGANWLYLLSPKFALSLEPTFQQKGYIIGLNKVKITYIDFSLNINKLRDLQLLTPNDYFFIGAGFYGGYVISGKNINGYNNTSSNISFGDAKTDERKRLDYGINFTTGLCFGGIVEMGFNFQPGLNNVLPKDLQINGNTTKLSSLALFVGINTSFLKNKK